MKKLLIIGLVFLIYCNVLADVNTPQQRLESYRLHQKLHGESLFKSVKWRGIGPYFMSGRIDDIEAYEGKPHKFFIATASGGLWVTENNGTTWTSLFDRESSITIGDIAISQTDENLIWVGTGEQNSSRSSYAGTGIFKSVDGGKSWKNMGLTDSHHISRVIVDPKNNDTVYAAVIGHLYTDNEERGVYKTTDGGKTWDKVLYISPKTGVIDLVMHPANPNILLAAAWQRERKAWNFTESGVESGIYKTVDGGKTWKPVNNGFPKNKYIGRIGLDICRANPDVMVALLDNQEPKPVEKKENKSGLTIEKISAMTVESFLKINDKQLKRFLKEVKAPRRLSAEFLKGAVKGGKLTLAGLGKHLADANTRLFNTNVKGAEVYMSTDGGESWQKTHDGFLQSSIYYSYGYYFGQIRVAPNDPKTMYVLGVPLMKSTDGGKTFKRIDNNPGMFGPSGVHADMQALWIDPVNPQRLLLGNDGGLNISYDGGGSWQKFNNLPLAQCYTVNIDMQKPYNVYTGLQDNGVNVGPGTFELGDRKDTWQRIMGGDGAFVYPEPGNPNVVYAEYQFGSIARLDRAKNSTTGIQPKSPDPLSPYRFNWLSPFLVSHHNPYTLYLGGNKVLKTVNRGDDWIELSGDLTDNERTDGDVPFATITALDESPVTPEILYAGTDDGNVWRTKNSGGAWDKVVNGLPKKWVTRVVASMHRKERVYVTMTGYRDDDFATYVFVSDDCGDTWRSLKGDLPEEPVNVIREDPVNEDVLYLGTDLTVYVSLDGGGKWLSLRGDLPTNAVYDMRVHPRERELVIATHGRGVFILPVKNIQLMTTDLRVKAVHLFTPDSVPLARYYWTKQKNAVLEFYLAKDGRVEIRVMDKDKRVLHKMSVAGERGLNAVRWDLKYGKDGETKVKAGTYTVLLKVGKSKVQGYLKVK